MLPDIRPLKTELSEKFDFIFRNFVNRYMGAMNEAPRSIIKEGRRCIILREDGSEDETLIKQSSAELSVPLAEIPRMSWADRIQKFDDAARKMASEINNHAFSELDKEIEKAGNIVDGKGQPFSPELYLEMIERISLDFESSGEHSPLTIVMSPEKREAAEKAMEKAYADPDFRRRYDELMAIKRRQWRAREASRKLVG